MRRLVWPAAGVLIVVVGVVWTLATPAVGEYGWFAYTPGSIGAGSDLVLLSRAHVAGIVIAALGVVVLAGWLGYRLGRRRT